MPEIHPHAATYVDAVASLKIAQTARHRRFEALQPTWHRFYKLVDSIGRERATEALPSEAREVEEFETSAPSWNTQMAEVLEALIVSLERRMRHLAEASVACSGVSMIGRLRADLKDLEKFRRDELDGVDGGFWQIVKQGHGVDRREKGRMINRILSSWCEVYEVGPETMVKAAKIIDLIPNWSFDGRYHDAEKARLLAQAGDYPFILADDLVEVRDWNEKEPSLIEELLEVHARHGGWPAVEAIDAGGRRP